MLSFATTWNLSVFASISSWLSPRFEEGVSLLLVVESEGEEYRRLLFLCVLLSLAPLFVSGVGDLAVIFFIFLFLDVFSLSLLSPLPLWYKGSVSLLLPCYSSPRIHSCYLCHPGPKVPLILPHHSGVGKLVTNWFRHLNVLLSIATCIKLCLIINSDVMTVMQQI